MRYAVVRAFNTPSRRFQIGQIITADEIDGPVDADARLETGLIRVESVDAPTPPLTLRRGPNVPQGQPVEMENDDAV